MHRKTWKGTIYWCFFHLILWRCEISTPFWKDDFKESLATLGTHPLCSFNFHYRQWRSKYQLQELQLKRQSVEIWYNDFLAQNIIPCTYLTLLPCLQVVNTSSIISFTNLSTYSCKLFILCYILRKYCLLVSTAKSPSEIWIEKLHYLLGILFRQALRCMLNFKHKLKSHGKESKWILGLKSATGCHNAFLQHLTLSCHFKTALMYLSHCLQRAISLHDNPVLRCKIGNNLWNFLHVASHRTHKVLRFF